MEFFAIGTLHQEKKSSSVRITFAFFTVDISSQADNLIRIISYVVGTNTQAIVIGLGYHVFQQLLQKVKILYRGV